MAVLTLPEAKAHLRIQTGTDDASVQDAIDAAVRAIEDRIGPIESISGQTHRAAGGGVGLLLPTGRAIISVQSVTPVGSSALDMADLYVNKASGVVELNLGGVFSARAYDIVYTAGHATVPKALKQAVKEMTRHLWDPQRGGSRRPGSQREEPDPESPALTPRVQELIKPYNRTKVR